MEKQNHKDTLPKLLLLNYEKYGNSKTALREKDRGIWQKYTWTKYFEIVRNLALALEGEGLKKGEKVAIIGENKPHVYWFELATQANRAAVVGIFSDCSASETKFFLEHSDCRFVVCQDQEQVDKVLEVKDQLPLLNKVIFWEEKGMWSYDHPDLLHMDTLLSRGSELNHSKPGHFEELIKKTRGEDQAVYFYSSGTTGQPKAAMQTHWNIINMAQQMDSRYPVLDSDESVSFLPIAWIAEQLFNVVHSLCKGFAVNFPEKQETVQENIREIGPQVLLLSPRLWEDTISDLRVKIADAMWLNRLFFDVAFKIGQKVADYKMEGRSISPVLRFGNVLADLMIFRPLRDRIGLGRIRLARTAGTAVSPDVIRYFHAIGVPLVQLYGSSECGVVTMHPQNQIKPESCGTALEGYEIKIAESGEIFVRSPFLFKGYYKEPEKSKNVIKDGYYLTGDFGRVDDDGHLIVMDRMDDLNHIGGDKVFSPQFAEIRLRFSPYIKDAIVVGEVSTEYAAVIINIDERNVGNWAEKKKLDYTTFADLSQRSEIIMLISQEIEEVNEYLPEYAQVKKFINLHKEFDPDEEEMTRTRKVRRAFMEKKYGQLIDAMFRNQKSTEMIASVAYRDGSITQLKSTLLVNDIG